MSWFTLSGRQVGWRAGLITAQIEEHFAYPDYPASVRWFEVYPFLQEVTFRLPAGIAPNELLGYGHIAGTRETVIPTTSFVLDFYLQQGAPLQFIDQLITQAVWEYWDDDRGVIFRLPYTFTFVFSIPVAEVILACPYAFVQRLRWYTEESTQAIRIQAEFLAPFIQILPQRVVVTTTYDPLMPMVLTREIVTTDIGERVGFLLNWELINNIEAIHSSFREGQPVEYIRTAPRFVYTGSNIRLTISVLGPYWKEDMFLRDNSLPPRDFSFQIRSRYNHPSFVDKVLRFYQCRLVNVTTTYSPVQMLAEEWSLVARYVFWGDMS